MADAIIDSAPKFHVTGAVHHYVRTPTTPSGDIYYLGTCEVQPDIRIWELSAEVKNDTHGVILPAQKTDQGKKADIGLQLTRFSRTAYTAIRTPRGSNVDGSNGLAVSAGWDGRFARGSLVFGSKTFELWQVFERSTSVTYRDSMPYGFYWPQVELIQHAPVKLGNQEEMLLLVLEAQPAFAPQSAYNTVGTFGRTHKLYDQADGAFPAAVLIPQ